MSQRTADSVLRPTQNVPILIYHHIQDISDDASEALRRWTVTPEQFAKHMKWIKEQGFNIMTMSRYNEILKHRSPPLSNPLVLTFDDGWKEHCTIAFPILEQYHYPATFFITTDSVGHSVFMDWKDLERMESAQMDIQSHSLTHPHLNRIPREEAYREISESKKALENHLHQKQVVFAYPFGAYSEKIIDMVKDAGYESATIVKGSNIGYLYRADRTYTIGRIAVEGDMTVDDIARSIQHVKNFKETYHEKDSIRSGMHQSFGCISECGK